MFCDVYTGSFPSRATELIQYNHIIHTASQSYVWENIYTYDIEFRKHMYVHPSLNWGIILNMAWTMCIKDRVSYQQRNNHFNGKGTNNKPQPSEMKQRKPCLDFNKGQCTYGTKCRFDHQCGFCSKYGHGTHSCKKFLNGNGGDAMNKLPVKIEN